MRIIRLAIVLPLLTGLVALPAVSQERLSNNQIVTRFINQDVLRNIDIKVLYDLSDVLKRLGKIKSERLEKAKITYEGMKGHSIRRIEYERFYAIIYKLDNGREVFGYLELKGELQYTKFNYGTPLNDYVSLTGDSINKWNEHTYSIYGKYKEDWDANVTVDVDSKGRISKVVLNIGGI